MAYTEVGSGSQRAAGGNNDGVASFTALSFPGSVTSGNLLIVAGAAWGATDPPTSIAVTDTRGTSYTVILGGLPPNELTWRTFIAYGVAPSSGANAVTVNPAGVDATHAGSFSIDEFAGEHATPASVDGGDSQNINTSPVSDGITTATDGELIIAVASHDGASGTWAATGGGTLIGKNDTNSGNQCHAAQFRIATTATAYTMSFTLSGTVSQASIQTHSFQAAAGGGEPAVGYVLVAN